MELLIGLIIAIAIFYWLFGGDSSKPSSRQYAKLSREEKIVNNNMSWLDERWSVARQELDTGKLKTIPRWFFDDVTDRQLDRLDEIGLAYRKSKITKGEASDLIGLFEPREYENEQILRFFKIPLKGMNQSRARYEVAKLFRQLENVESWNSRPASQIQKEYFRHFGLKIPKGLTNDKAEKLVQDHQNEFSEEDEWKLDEWATYEDMYEEFNDPDFRELYDLNVVSLTLYRSAIDELKSEGKTMDEINFDIDGLVEKIISLKPEILKAT